MSKHLKISLFVGCVITGLYLFFAIPITYPAIPQINTLYIRIIVIVLTAIVLGLLLFLLSVLLIAVIEKKMASHELSDRLFKTYISRWEWIFCTIPTILIWSIYLIAYWPGIMTNDSNDQWNQVFTGNFNDWHPAFHTINLWLLTRVWASPAIVVFAQITVTSLVIAWGIIELRKNGASTWAGRATVILFCLLPVYPQMTITLLKDVAYSVSILALSILALKIVFSQGTWLTTKSAWAKLGIVSALVALYRHNGPPVAFGFLLIAGIYYRSYWKPLLKGLILGVALFVLVTGPIYEYFKVVKAKEDMIKDVAFFGVAAHVVNDPTIRLDKNNHYLTKIMPLKGWRLYDCHSATFLIYSSWYHTPLFDQYKDRLPNSYIELTKENPSVTLDHILCITSYLWRIKGETGKYYVSTLIYQGVTKEHQEQIIRIYGYNLQYFSATIPHTTIPKVHDFINSATASIYNRTSGMLWRPALFLYLMLFAIIIYSIKVRSFAMSLLAVPSLIQTGIMFVLSLNSELRYQYPIFLVGLLVFLPLITCTTRENKLTYT